MKFTNRIIVLAFGLVSLFSFVSRCYAAETKTVDLGNGKFCYVEKNFDDVLRENSDAVFDAEFNKSKMRPGATYCFKAVNIDRGRKMITLVDKSAN